MNTADMQILDVDLPAPLFMCDEQGRLLAVTNAWVELTGVTRERALGKHIADILKANPTADGPAGAGTIRRPDGTTRIVMERRGPGASAGSYIGSLTDVTEQVESSRQLGDAMESLRLAQEAGDVGTWDWRVGENVARCSPHYRHMLGLSPGTTVGYEDWFGALHPDDRASALAAIEKALRDGQPYQTEYRVVLPDGGVRWLSKRCRVECGPDGRARRLLGATVDITDRKLAEEALRTSRDRFARLFQDCPIYLQEVDISAVVAAVRERMQAGVRNMNAYLRANPREITNIARLRRVVSANPATLALLGFNSVNQCNIAVERMLTARQVERWREQIVAISRGRMVEQFETTVLTPYGERDLLGCISILESDENGPRTILYSSIDLTEHKRLEAQIREMQKLDAVGTVAAGVAHDINNVLTAILGHAELARQLAPNGEVANAIEGIQEASRQATTLVRSLLTFGRRAEREFEAVDLGRVVEDSLRLIRRVLPASIAIEFENSCPNGVWVLGDATRLQQVIMNLAINARDAMPEGGKIAISLTESTSDEENRPTFARLVVSDTGVGMDDAVRQRLFDPFFTTKARGQGTGLGMSVVQAIITDHSAEINVDSAPGQGTSITITIETCISPAPARAASQEDRAPRGSGETILLGEDNPQVRAILETTLRRADYEILSARDGQEVVDLFTRHKSSVRAVIIDLDLPKKSGASSLREIRAIQPGVPAIVITGGIEVDKSEFTGPNTELLRKPFRVNDLLSTMARFCAANHESTSPETNTHSAASDEGPRASAG